MRFLIPPAFCVVALLSVNGCGTQPDSKPAKKVEKPKVEDDLAYVTITDKAYKALLLKIAPVRTEQVQEQLQLTGWVMVPQGNEVTLTSPVSGYVKTAEDSTVSPREGEAVKRSQELFQVKPVLSPVEQIQMAALKRAVEGELAKAKTSVKVAKDEYDRLKDLYKEKLRSQQDLDKAKERFDHATEDLQAAKDKQVLFVQELVSIASPRDGTVLTVHASPGQFVTASSPLISIADLSDLWIRVPVPEYHVQSVNVNLPIQVALVGKPGFGNAEALKHPSTFAAKPVALVPKVDTIKHTVDFIYAIPDKARDNNTLVKDQMVSAFLPMGTKSKQSVVPYSAVVFDGQKNAWIYLVRGKNDAKIHQFERRRVQLGPRIDDDIVIQPPLAAGEHVVSQGAGVLLSREFHSTPVDAGDDD